MLSIVGCGGLASRRGSSVSVSMTYYTVQIELVQRKNKLAPMRKIRKIGLRGNISSFGLSSRELIGHWAPFVRATSTSRTQHSIPLSNLLSDAQRDGPM
jgi:hypothetical protein